MSGEPALRSHAYDFIIAGSGAAGLGLAYQIAMSPLRGLPVLVVDRDTKERNDRTWSFWTNRSTRFDHLVYHTWEQVEVVSDHFQQVYDIRPYQYKVIRGIDFYHDMRASLAGTPGMRFLQARVSDVSDTKEKTAARVVINEEPYSARFAFDSTFIPSDFSTSPGNYHFLKRHFKGWEIETPADCFDPSTVTMFDFRTPQKGSMRFFHILPFTRRRALVEYTIFSTDLLKPHEYDRAIAEYLENVRRISRYRTASVETGAVPMTDRPFPRQIGKRVMAIGTKGGLVKPSLGCAFPRIQNDAASIVRSLTDIGNPFLVPETPRHYRLFDTLMLQVMYRQGSQMNAIFTRLFQRNTVQDMFRFFDEAASMNEYFRLVTSLPSGPFLKALFRVKLLRKV